MLTLPTSRNLMKEPKFWMDGCFSRYRNNAGSYYRGLLAELGNSVPIFIGALFTFLNAVYGYTFMLESLPIKTFSRFKFLPCKTFSPITTIIQDFIRYSFIDSRFCCLVGSWLSSIYLFSISIDAFQWKAGLVGLSFSLIGILDTVSQLFIMPRLLKNFQNSRSQE